MIGILTKPASEEYPDINTSYTEVIEAKYAHFIEAGGGRAVPLSFTASKEELREKMKKLNGVLFTGGGVDPFIYDQNDFPIDYSDYGKGAKSIFEIAQEFNKEIHFPIWGICLGYVTLMIMESQNLNLLKPCTNCDNYNINLVYTEIGRTKSRLFNSISTKAKQYMEAVNITQNNHDWMIDNETFYSNELLVEKYNILSYSQWLNDTKLFISAVEHKELPFYGIQFHPEKWGYEADPSQNIIKSKESIALGYAFSNFFVEECKKNNNSFSDYSEELKNVIEAYYFYYHPQHGLLYFFGNK